MRPPYTEADLDFLPAFARMIGPKPPVWFKSNGCSWSPDVLFGADLRPAAHWHDYAYSESSESVLDTEPRTEETRYRADQLLLGNLQLCGLGCLRWAYYYRVRLWGHFAFEYSPGFEPDRTVGFWWRLLIGRYVQW